MKRWAKMKKNQCNLPHQYTTEKHNTISVNTWKILIKVSAQYWKKHLVTRNKENFLDVIKYKNTTKIILKSYPLKLTDGCPVSTPCNIGLLGNQQKSQGIYQILFIHVLIFKEHLKCSSNIRLDEFSQDDW